jgi:hypothetical protein
MDRPDLAIDSGGGIDRQGGQAGAQGGAEQQLGN